jgi:hypothetical protein
MTTRDYLIILNIVKKENTPPWKQCCITEDPFKCSSIVAKKNILCKSTQYYGLK